MNTRSRNSTCSIFALLRRKITTSSRMFVERRFLPHHPRARPSFTIEMNWSTVSPLCGIRLTWTAMSVAASTTSSSQASQKPPEHSTLTLIAWMRRARLTSTDRHCICFRSQKAVSRSSALLFWTARPSRIGLIDDSTLNLEQLGRPQR